MNGLTRFGGYLGLVGLVGAAMILALVPPGGRFAPEPALRGQARDAALSGLVLIVIRLGYVAVSGRDRRTRVLAGLGMMTLILAFVGYVGALIVLPQPKAAA